MVLLEIVASHACGLVCLLMFFASLLGCVLSYDPPFAVAKSPDSQLPGDAVLSPTMELNGKNSYGECDCKNVADQCWSLMLYGLYCLDFWAYLGHILYDTISKKDIYIYINPPIMAPGKLGFFRVSARTPHGSMVNSPLGWSSWRPYGPFVVLRRRWLRNHRERVLRKIMSLLCKSRRVQWAR